MKVIRILLTALMVGILIVTWGQHPAWKDWVMVGYFALMLVLAVASRRV